jgi:nitrite reductase/ring-hydroxylating ferredoxin subunit
MTRRTVLRGAVVGGAALPLLAACGPGDNASAAVPAGTSLGTTSAVPVGGGTILGADRVVLTQPAKGDFKAFTAICTHQSCVVSTVSDGTINCGCHGSKFSIKDGSNVVGPNGRAAGSIPPLAAVKIKVKGEKISKA